MAQAHPTGYVSTFDALPDSALVRLAILIAWGLLPFSRATLWRKVRSGHFPRPVKVSCQVTAWRVGDVRRWLADPRDFRATTGGERLERLTAKRRIPESASRT